MKTSAHVNWTISLDEERDRFLIEGGRWQGSAVSTIEARVVRSHYGHGKVEITGPSMKKDGTLGAVARVVVVHVEDERLPWALRVAATRLMAAAKSLTEGAALVSEATTL